MACVEGGEEDEEAGEVYDPGGRRARKVEEAYEEEVECVSVKGWMRDR